MFEKNAVGIASTTRLGIAALVCTLMLPLAGCFDGNKPAIAKFGGTAGEVTPPPTPAPTNSAPTISGTAPTSAKVNQAYTFQPTASDPDGDKLTFQISNKPVWASFDLTTGRLSGTPSSSATGTFADIRIAVSDGKVSSALPGFSIAVADTQLGSATLSWQPPTENTDGTPLTNLAGYTVRYGTAVGSLQQQVRITNPGLTTYVVEGLTAATWYFQVAAYNSDGIESAPSATASKTIS
jgi:hypothetical protein